MGGEANGRISWAIIRAGRKLFRNTPIQRLPLVTAIYRKLFARLHPPGRETIVRYLGSEYVVPTGDITVVPSLMAGDYERAEFDALGRLLRPGMVVVDVGANIGLHAVFFGRAVGRTGRVMAFEPEPSNFGYLARNVTRNDVPQVETFMKAAGEREGQLTLYMSEGNVGTHSAAPTGGAALEVEIVRLDEFLRHRADRIDLIKIDVEGYEAQVLDGLRETLERDCPAMMIEFSPELLRRCGASPDRVLTTLRRLYPAILLFDSAGDAAVPLDDANARSLLASSVGSRNLLCSGRREVPHHG